MRLFELDAGPRHVLILVHPGSACGSANMNLGKYAARAARDGLAYEINAWEGDIIVVDGSLSDELPHYPVLHSVLQGALLRAKTAGLISVRLFACDDVTPNWPEKVMDLVHRVGLQPSNTVFTVSGAWYHPANDGGCVNAVYDDLRAAGFRANISDGAVALVENEDED